MKSPFQVTLLCGLLTAAVCGGAAWFYPWPEFSRDQLGAGQGLFAPFDAGRVWSIRIVEFDQEKQTPRGFALQRSGERWLAAAQGGFPCNNVARRTSVVNALIRLVDSKAILDNPSDRQEDHIKYGVVDPSELQPNTSRAGVGTHVILEDRNRQTLAELIVGLPVDDAQRTGQAFVRIPGQPQVYLTEFAPGVLSTEFRDWVDTNLFQLRTQARPDGETIRNAVVTSPSAAEAIFEKKPPDAHAWRGEVSLSNGRLATRNIERWSGQAWDRCEALPAVQQQLVEAVSQLGGIPVVDARPLSQPLGENLSTSATAGDSSLYSELWENGFRQVAAAGEALKFESAGGMLEVSVDSGWKMTMFLGPVYPEQKTSSKLARMAVLRAVAEPDRFPKPAEPLAAADGQLTDEQRREYNRQIEAWQKEIDSANARVSAFNLQHGRWMYVLDESTVRRLIPKLPELKVISSAAPAAAETPAGPADPATPPVSPEKSGGGQSAETPG